MYGILVAAFVAALITAAVTPSVQRWAEKIGGRLVDQPSERRVNTEPKPRAGGIAICLGFLVAVLLTVTVRQFSREGQHTWTWQVAGVLTAVVFAGLVGLVDDLKDLSPRMQILGMVGAGLILVAFGVRIEGITNPLGGSPGNAYNPLVNWHPLSLTVSVLLTVLWVFTVTKTVDAIDGVDGLASGVCAISAGTLALMATQLHTSEGPTLALIAAAVMGSCLGFLRYNYHPSKIIMGTVGAWVLGVALAAISILGAFKGAAAVSVLVPILVLGVPLLDYAHVLTRRILEHAPLTKADKRHLHHRLLARKWSQPKIVWFICSVAIVLCLVALVIFQQGRISH
jgi:UDP-GlcNAc:undecaprenyl-phosphate GlcNAc-1-phosphate transferase